VGAYFTTALHGTVIGFASPVIESIPGEKSSPRNGKGYRVRIRLHFGKTRTSHLSMPLPLFVTPWDLMIQGKNQNLLLLLLVDLFLLLRALDFLPFLLLLLVSGKLLPLYKLCWILLGNWNCYSIAICIYGHGISNSLGVIPLALSVECASAPSLAYLGNSAFIRNHLFLEERNKLAPRGEKQGF